MAYTPKANKMGSGGAGSRPFQYGSIPGLSSTLTSSGSGLGGSITRPNLKSIPQSALNGYKSKIDAANALSANPLGDPGAAATLSAIQGTLNRQQQAGIGAAKGRAAGSGQAAFQGALANTAAGLQQANAAAYGDAAAQLALKLGEQGRQEAFNYSQLQQQGEVEAARNAMQKYNIDADMASNEAQLRQSALLAQQNNLIDQARLAEQARQFGLTSAQDQGQFDDRMSLSRDEMKFNKSQASQKTKMDQDAFNLRKKESEFSRAKDLLNASSAARDLGLAGDDAVMGALGNLGVSPIAKQSTFDDLYPTLNPNLKASLLSTNSNPNLRAMQGSRSRSGWGRSAPSPKRRF